MTNSIVFYLSLYSFIGILWYRYTTFLLRSPSGTYIHFSFITTLSSINYFSSWRLFIPILFSSSTTFTTFLFPSYAFLILSLRFPSSTSISTSLIHSSLINILSLLSFSTPFCQSALWLSPLALSMLFLGMCFKVKLKHDKYKVYQTCLWFNFWLIMKYWRFL